MLCSLRLPTSRIDRRPSPKPGDYDSIYIAEVFRPGAQGESVSEARNCAIWEGEVQEGIKRVIHIGGEAALLGLW
jgi:hypothetical protein